MSSLLDRLYARVSNRRLFFRQGWGDLTPIREVQANGYHPGPTKKIDINWTGEMQTDGMIVRQGRFSSPFNSVDFPEESHMAHVEWVMPAISSSSTPVGIHFAATGDEGFSRRRTAFAKPLARVGIGSMILENPYYGLRRPAGQHSKMLRYVSDLWTMGVATIAEGRSLSKWLFDHGYEKQAACGISMGGHMAAKVGLLSDIPMAVACIVAPHSAAAVFTEGLLKKYCAWDILNRKLGGQNGNAYELMRELLALTDIQRLPVPRKPQWAVFIGARKDAYISEKSIRLLHEHWPGSRLRWIESGHVGAFLFYRKAFLNAIMDALERVDP
ncbi:MAG: hypothetical protein CSYNP_02482 [Syntrophus sp. SKADARSKE-3]|nr:hypothetical protein [Syntrophus sp. SKADARSKE-3]